MSSPITICISACKGGGMCMKDQENYAFLGNKVGKKHFSHDKETDNSAIKKGPDVPSSALYGARIQEIYIHNYTHAHFAAGNTGTILNNYNKACILTAVPAEHAVRQRHLLRQF